METEMQSRWVRSIAYLLLAALVIVASCQAMAGAAGAPALSPAASSMEGARR
jgi:hypothetical protein